MRITVGRLRYLFSEAMAEARIAASAEYMQKEAVREHVQKHVIDVVKKGEVSNQEQLDAFWQATDIAMKALKGVPYDVWAKMADTKR